ncbi:mesoderm posterior protein 1-like [Pogoniulus pusillus]|uniref:mesoderm posterior protein 1-like n=1 Tax=Pogoniulus pusillus TaxID=488313 RepID=UPI0030B9460D
MSTGLLRDLDATIPNPSAELPRTSPRHPRGREPETGGRWGGRAELGQCGGPGGPRQSASEREKLRMRRLAQALLQLRHYLPPTLAPAGQSLTKIETLRLATRYIAHLSALLGLSEEVLARRRGTPPRHCPLCPQGLGCCQGPVPRLCAPAPRDASSPGSVGWASPPTAVTPPELHEAPGVETGSWGFPRYVPAAGTPPEVLGVPDTGMETWASPHYIPVTGTPLELHHLPSSISGSWMSPPDLGAVTPLGPPQRGTVTMGTWTASSCCLESATTLEYLQAGLADTGPPGTPACGSRLPERHQLCSPPASDSLASPAPCAPLILPSCTPARHWGGSS